MSKAVDILLLGKNYRIACPEGQEERLRSAAEELTNRLSEAQQKTSAHGELALTMLVALNLSYDLLEERKSNRDYTASMDLRIKSLQNTIEQALLEQSPLKS